MQHKRYMEETRRREKTNDELTGANSHIKNMKQTGQ